MKKLVNELVAVIQGHEPEVVERAFKKAMNQVRPEPTTGKFNELFNTQMETLKARGCPKGVIDALTAKKSEVIAKATEIETADGHIPFVPVVPRTEVDLGDLMKMVRNRDREGYNYLDQSYISNVVDVPKGPYFIYDVEDGKDMLDKSPEKAEAFIKKQKRTCLTADEGIALCVHTNVLSEHYVDCTGSRYGRAGARVPRVYLSDDKPELYCSYASCSDYEWGSASCRCRV